MKTIVKHDKGKGYKTVSKQLDVPVSSDDKLTDNTDIDQRAQNNLQIKSKVNSEKELKQGIWRRPVSLQT